MENNSTQIPSDVVAAFGLNLSRNIDRKLAAAIMNPASKCTERYVMNRGQAALYISGMYVASIGEFGRAKSYLIDLAERYPNVPAHIRTWAESLN